MALLKMYSAVENKEKGRKHKALTWRIEEIGSWVYAYAIAYSLYERFTL